jgi:predicted enzyme related to lactoylglutathione lyase
MLRGMTTMNLTAEDPAAAAEWYAGVLGQEPYFRRDDEATGEAAYIEFRIGDFSHELGILNRRFAPWGSVPGGVVTYWAVDDVHAAYEALLAAGAAPHVPPMERGPGFIPASVVDPFGNILGVMKNVHYESVVAGHPAVVRG